MVVRFLQVSGKAHVHESLLHSSRRGRGRGRGRRTRKRCFDGAGPTQERKKATLKKNKTVVFSFGLKTTRADLMTIQLGTWSNFTLFSPRQKATNWQLKISRIIFSA